MPIAGVGTPNRPRVAALLVLLAAACAPLERTAAEGSVVPPIRTDRDAYLLTPIGSTSVGLEQFVIVATYRNPLATTVHLAECDGRAPHYRLERRTDGGWVNAHEPNCALTRPERLPVLAPGEARTDTITVRHFPGAVPSFRGEVTGRYRMVYEVYRSWDASPPAAEEPVPEGAAVSNEFGLRR